MSKDAKGHGSESRGGIGAQAKARAREAFRTGNYPGKDAIQRGGGPFDPKTGKDRYGNTAPGRTETDDAIRKGMAAEMSGRANGGNATTPGHDRNIFAQELEAIHSTGGSGPLGAAESHVRDIAAQHGVGTDHLVSYHDPLAPEPSNPWQDIRKGSAGMKRF